METPNCLLKVLAAGSDTAATRTKRTVMAAFPLTAGSKVNESMTVTFKSHERCSSLPVQYSCRGQVSRFFSPEGHGGGEHAGQLTSMGHEA